MRSSFNRRQIVAGLAGAVAVRSGPALGKSVSGRPPNIVFILADDLGYADIGCYGGRNARTPAIDGLAERGLLLTDSYSNSCVCSPTRLALITGRYQYRLPAGLKEPIRAEQIGIPAGRPTLPALLRKQGYRTSLIGKWHLGEPPHFGPLSRGYDRFYGIYKGGADYFTHRSGREPAAPTDGLFDGERRSKDVGYLTDLLAARAVKEITDASRDDVPLFLSLHFTTPHWPWEGPEDEAVSKALRDIQHMDGGSLKTYRSMLESLDRAVRTVVDGVAASRGADDTIIVFTSDNGGERYSDMWPLLGRKGELLEGGIRVPTLISWPRRIKGPRVSRQVTMTMDWLPTLLAAAGRPLPAGEADGVGLLPVFLSEQRQIPRTVFWRHHAQDQAAVRSGDWKYLRIAEKEYLFDLSGDQVERANLKDVHPETFARLRADFDRWNAKMLPYRQDDFSYSLKGTAPDRY